MLSDKHPFYHIKITTPCNKAVGSMSHVLQCSVNVKASRALLDLRFDSDRLGDTAEELE